MSRGTRWGWATLIAAGVTVVKLLDRPAGSTLQGLRQPHGILLMGSVLVLLIALAWVSLWSWGRLRPVWRDEQRQWHIDMGVMGFGVPLAFVLAVLQALHIVDQHSWHLVIEWQFWAALLISLLISLPLGMWGGRLFGAGLDWTQGRR
jgi:hypothetical protein